MTSCPSCEQRIRRTPPAGSISPPARPTTVCAFGAGAAVLGLSKLMRERGGADSEQPVRSAGVGRNDGDRERASPRERERDRDRRDQWDDKDRRDKDRDRDRRDRDRDRDRDRRDRDRRDRNRDRDRDRDKKRKSSKEGSGEEGHTKKAKDGADDANA